MELSPVIVGAIGVIVLLILILARMWIGFAMGIVGFLGFAYIVGIDPAFTVLARVPFTTLSSYTFSVIPLFIMMGVFAGNTGISADLYRSANAWFGHVRGGLAMGTSVACAAFAAICGHSAVGTLTMGKIAIPEMQKYKYADSLSAACVSAGGTLGILIPPSLPFIIYALLTEQSIGKLFMAGIFPGILLVTLFILIIGILARINPSLAPAGPKTSLRQKITSLKYTWAMLFIFFLVMGGIYAGIFTPTEAGAIGAIGTIIVAIASRRLHRRNTIDSLLQTARISGMLLTIMMGAFIFMRFLTISNLPFALSEIITSMPYNRYVIFGFIILLYIILGMFMDIMPCIILTIPILFPVIVGLGFDPIWYGVIMMVVAEMGMITPPIGLNVFILSRITDIPAGTIFRGVWPFVAAMLICLILLTAFPQIALFLPGQM
jgi:tripartite ATP-independent transporter DctM subunit